MNKLTDEFITYKLIKPVPEPGNTVSIERGNGDDVHFRETHAEVNQIFFRSFQVHFVGDDEPGLFGQVFAVQFNFRAEILKVFNGVAAFAAGHVQNEDEHFAARDVAQEFMSQAPVVVCAFNDAGNVRHNAAAKAVEFHHSNDRLKRGKRIAGYFGLGFRNVSQQCAFARVGVAYQPGVRNAAQ